MSKQLTLVLGGARSGKSHYAVKWAGEQGRSVLFVATAQADDEEMQERIARHRAVRPTHWRTLEAPIRVAEGIRRQAGRFDIVVVDCITLLASNVLLGLPDDSPEEAYSAALMQEIDDLLHVYQETDSTWLIVSNEVGMGLVPPYRLGRLFRDGLGQANQRLADAADGVVLLVASLPWRLKPGW